MNEQVLKKYKLENTKYYRLDTLYSVMQDTGIVNMNRNSFTNNWMRRKIKSGLLILPLKGKHDLWKLTGKEIKAIVLAFAPGGKGYYNYKTEGVLGVKALNL